jgi:hypothetical protein
VVREHETPSIIGGCRGAAREFVCRTNAEER